VGEAAAAIELGQRLRHEATVPVPTLSVWPTNLFLLSRGSDIRTSLKSRTATRNLGHALRRATWRTRPCAYPTPAAAMPVNIAPS